MSKELIKVGIANEGEKNITIEDMMDWQPKNVNYFGDTVYFKHEDKYYTMKIVDFKKVFSK